MGAGSIRHGSICREATGDHSGPRGRGSATTARSRAHRPATGRLSLIPFLGQGMLAGEGRAAASNYGSDKRSVS